MKKIYRIIIMTALMLFAFTLTAFAGTWRQDARGWWWDEGNGTYPAGCWAWCDGDLDGTAECYYFDNNGYCLMNTVTPDGYQVNASGAWVVNGVVQTQYVGVQTPGSNYVTTQQTASGAAESYTLSGWQSLTTGEEGTGYGYLNLRPDGTGEIRIDADSPQYELTWSGSGDELHLNYGFADHTAYRYPELGQIRLPIGEYLFYFNA